MAPNKTSLKLLFDSRSQTVLFAEAGKEFVDLLFGFLTFTIGTVARLILISGGGMPGSSVGRLYQSVVDIDPSYLQPGGNVKSSLLRPKVLNADARELRLMQGCDGRSPLGKQKVYTCAGDCAMATVETSAVCPRCSQAMSTEVACFSLTTSDKGGGGYVKAEAGLLTYLVTDGLQVTPMSAISCIKIFNNKLNAGKDVELAEKVVTVGVHEVLALLKAALRSDTVLSDVFLTNKK